MSQQGEVKKAAATTVIRHGHAKSKRGCKICKTRRVKCDELRPSCYNCIRGGRTCVYVNISGLSYVEDWGGARSTSPSALEPEPEMASIMHIYASPKWHDIAPRTLWYLGWLAQHASLLAGQQATELSLWWNKIPVFFKLAVNFDFVASMIAAHVAGYLAIERRSSAIQKEAISLRISACQGLNRAISNFSRDNSDALLASSIIFSMQQTEWKSWKKVTEGTSKVIHEMNNWLHYSEFSDHLVRDISIFSAQNLRDIYDLKIARPMNGQPIDLNSLLSLGIDSLNQLRGCLKSREELSAVVKRLHDSLHLVRNRQSAWSLEDQFRITYHWRLGWIPHGYSSLSQRDSLYLITISHVFGIFVALSTKFNVFDQGYLIFNRLKAITEICSIFDKVPIFLCESCEAYHDGSRLLGFPCQAVALYCSRTLR
ncbi:hypothetical protein F5884DRAFT_865966 [Xylogone sp. PMI_703]|nr:hypothetical protein F5884DRAFT_865966 [Xylogone sp. PMI_703]